MYVKELFTFKYVGIIVLNSTFIVFSDLLIAFLFKMLKNKLINKILIIVVFTIAYGSVNSQNIDIDILKNINQNRIINSAPAFRFVTNSAIPVSVAAPLIIPATGYLTKDSLTLQNGLLAAGSFLVSTAISTAMKYSFNRPRPFETYPDEITKLSSGGSPSFPSGHTSAAFSTATSISLAYPKWYIITPAFIWAGAVGFSRMDLGVHYPSDVFMGALVGAGSAFLTDYVNKKLINNCRKNRLHKKKEIYKTAFVSN